MNDITDVRQFLTDYVHQEEKLGNFDVTEENQHRIVDILEYFGLDVYRPLTKLLLQNWNIINSRVAVYSKEQWDFIKQADVADKLDEVTVAILCELLEGEDTEEQAQILQSYVVR